MEPEWQSPASGTEDLAMGTFMSGQELAEGEEDKRSNSARRGLEAPATALANWASKSFMSCVLTNKRVATYKEDGHSASPKRDFGTEESKELALVEERVGLFGHKVASASAMLGGGIWFTPGRPGAPRGGTCTAAAVFEPASCGPPPIRAPFSASPPAPLLSARCHPQSAT